MTKKVFETKTLFKEMPNLLLEAKNVRISCVYETHTIRPLFTSFHNLRKLCSFAFKILKVISINRKSSVKQYFKDILTIKNSIYWAVELPKCRKAFHLSQQVRFSISSRLIRIALENRRVVNSKAHLVPFKTVMSIFFRFAYSLAYLLFILNSIRSISVEKGRL